MNISQIGTVVDRSGTDPIHASRALGLANTPTTPVPTAHPGRCRTHFKCLATGMAVIAVTGCASQPVQLGSAAAAQSAQSHNAVATPVSAPVAQSPKTRDEGSALASAIDSASQAEAVNLAAAAGGMPAQEADQLAANLAKARKLGYRIVDKNGETVYCHDSVATGAHLNKRIICLTEKQWENVSTNSARAMERLQNTRNGCPGRAPCEG